MMDVLGAVFSGVVVIAAVAGLFIFGEVVSLLLLDPEARRRWLDWREGGK
jgi:hypothetical protein